MKEKTTKSPRAEDREFRRSRAGQFLRLLKDSTDDEGQITLMIPITLDGFEWGHLAHVARMLNCTIEQAASEALQTGAEDYLAKVQKGRS